jgi:glutathione S-transferase
MSARWPGCSALDIVVAARHMPTTVGIGVAPEQGEGGEAFTASGVELTQTRGEPAHRVERARRSSPVVPRRPRVEERMEIFSVRLAKRHRLLADFDLAELAASSEGYVGAEIEQAIVDAMYVGFRRERDGTFAAVISEYDRATHNDAWLGRLTARHAYHVTGNTLAAQGFQLVNETTEQDGTVRMVLRRVP